MPSNHLILCHPLLLPPSVFPSLRVFSKQSVFCIRWPKYWSFSFSICPSSEYSELIAFRMDWLDLLAVQGTLKNLLQHHSSKASILRHSAFFIVQLPHPYMTTGKTIALIRGFPGGSEVKASAFKKGRPGFDPWVWKIPLGKEMATHSSILAWRIPWTEEPGGLQSTGSQRVGHD